MTKDQPKTHMQRIGLESYQTEALRRSHFGHAHAWKVQKEVKERNNNNNLINFSTNKTKIN